MIGALLSRFATPLLIAALVAASGALIVNGIKLHRAERALQKAEKAKVAAELAFDELVRDYNEQARMADARERRKETEAAEAVIQLRDDYAQRLAAKDRTVRAALDGLRYAEEGARRRALLPREAAPADCSNYAADPRNLSVHDAELSLRISGAAEEVVGRLAYCDGYIRRVVPSACAVATSSREEAGKADVE